MTIEILNNRGIEIEGIIFVGDEHPTTEEAILSNTGLRGIARIPLAKEVNQEFILSQAEIIKNQL